MSDKKNSSHRLEAFFAGKGFYIVLFLCVAVIGISAWIMLNGTGTDVEGNTNEGEAAGIMMPTETESTVISEPPAERDSSLTETEAPEAGEPVEEPEAEPVDVPVAEPPVTEVWNRNEVQNHPDYYVWPVNGEIEVPYSVTALRYDRTMRDWRTHDGIDIAAELGTPVMAAGSGTVTGVRRDGLYGVTVEITHANGLVSIYSNLAELPTVQEGDGVMVGEIIGSVGDTALCEAAEVYHLHFAMSKDGKPVDPLTYLPER